MTAKKIYRAYVTYDFEMFVVADSEAQAQAIAADNADEAFRDFCLTADVTIRKAGNPAQLLNEDTLPYGDDDDKTVAEYAAALIEAQREAEEKSRIEANQLKLPLGGA